MLRQSLDSARREAPQRLSQQGAVIDSSDIPSPPAVMAVMTICDLDDEVRDKLRIRAAHNKRSM